LNEEKRFRSWFTVKQPDHRRIQISPKHRNVFSLSSSKASASIQGQKVMFVSKSILKEESKKKNLALEKIVRRENSFKEDKEEEGGYRELCGNRFGIIIRSWDKIKTETSISN
jgi:hypothetical protein